MGGSLSVALTKPQLLSTSHHHAPLTAQFCQKFKQTDVDQDLAASYILTITYRETHQTDAVLKLRLIFYTRPLSVN